MKDLTANFNNGNRGDLIPDNIWRAYSPSSQKTWLTDDRPEDGDDQYGNGLFATTTPPGQFHDSYVPTYYRVVTKEAFSRPVLPEQAPLHISGWVRVNKFRADANDSHGAKFHLMHEDSQSNYLVNLLKKDKKINVFKEDRAGDTEPSYGRSIASPTTFHWSYKTRYRFDIVLTHDEIMTYINGQLMHTAVDKDLRVGQIGWRGDRTQFDWGGIVIR